MMGEENGKESKVVRNPQMTKESNDDKGFDIRNLEIFFFQRFPLEF